MSEAALGLLAALYTLFAVIDLWVDWRMVPAAREKPHIDSLTVTAIMGVCVTIGGVLGALLGVNAVALNLWHFRVIPQELSLVILAAALGAPSVGKVFAWRAFRRWSIVARQAHVHRRDNEPTLRLHRRGTDVQPKPDADEDWPTGIG